MMSQENARMSDTESGFYLIDNEVEFHPEFLCMTSRTTSQKIVLKSQASSCLQLLLLKHNTLVTQNELMAFAWGEKHRQVPFNAFYQSILAIRKAFTFLGMKQTIIQTLPRKGLIIPESVTVTYLTKITQPLDRDTILSSIDVKNSFPIANQPVMLVNTTNKNICNRWKIFTFLTALAFLIIALSLWIMSADSDYFVNYTKAGVMTNGCEYYFNADTDNHSKHLSILHALKNVCMKNKAIYITSYEDTGSVSVVACDGNISVDAVSECKSYFYPVYHGDSSQ